MNYKEEALREFIGILSDEDLLSRIVSHRSKVHNVLATLALEYAECRGNLNKEQCFLFLATY